MPPSYLLHSLDFVGSGEHSDLGFFPGMDVAWPDKAAMVDHLLARLARGFAVQPLGTFAAQRLPRGSLAGAS